MTHAPHADDLREAAALIVRHFGLGEASDRPLSPDDLPEWLARRILELLRGDLGQLTNILYRIDVSERAVDAAFAAGSLEDVAAELATLVLRRELQTVALRRSLDGDPEGSP